MPGIKIFKHLTDDGKEYYVTYWAGKKRYIVFLGDGRNELIASMPRGITAKHRVEYMLYKGPYTISKSDDAIYINCE